MSATVHPAGSKPIVENDSGKLRGRLQPDWRFFSIAERPAMIFDNPCKLVDDPAREERLALERHPAYEADALFRR